MNCKQVHELLPLFVGHDLEDSRARQVAAHVQECAHCAGAADEYRETRQMMQQFSPPQFSEGVYAAMRQRVLREIKASSSSSISSRFVAGLFRPRLSWVVATVLVIALAWSAIYFIANRPNRQESAAHPPITSHEQTSARSQHDQQVLPPSSLSANNNSRRVGGRQRRNYSNAVADRSGSVAMSASTNPSPAADNSLKLDNSTESAAPAEGDSEKPLRMELQTKDPNIRIIWFSRPNTGRVGAGSKGI